MALSLTIGPRFAQQAFEFTVTRSSLFLEVGRFSFFADIFGAPDGAPRWDVSRHEDGSGWSLIIGRGEVVFGR
ncbi:hypothetical protein GH865_11785 [Rhodocyclus tenuis]|uniref:Uncharacterized protein n=1 Tax=Rhodocyclus tenuis TaxID=1066 RepID=A0A6L5JVL7_RHOTE|nr:hypothetical protein [Rhodocyclus gracilis]MQY51279.1 hypothetical protein [Rhodocyclus gracilis]MRD73921.1 hypothetical protein [Rhodocyclus gracilis]